MTYDYLHNRDTHMMYISIPKLHISPAHRVAVTDISEFKVGPKMDSQFITQYLDAELLRQIC